MGNRAEADLAAEVLRLGDLYAGLLGRLAEACGVDPEVAAGMGAEGLLAVVRRKVAEFDERIEVATRAVEEYRLAAEVENRYRVGAERQRDAAVRLLAGWAFDRGIVLHNTLGPNVDPREAFRAFCEEHGLAVHLHALDCYDSGSGVLGPLACGRQQGEILRVDWDRSQDG